jgi:hypothetical protein
MVGLYQDGEMFFLSLNGALGRLHEGAYEVDGIL